VCAWLWVDLCFCNRGLALMSMLRLCALLVYFFCVLGCLVCLCSCVFECCWLLWCAYEVYCCVGVLSTDCFNGLV